MGAFMGICSQKQSREVKLICFERGDTQNVNILGRKNPEVTKFV